MKIWCMIGMLLFTLISHNALASEVPEDVYLPHFLKKDTIEAFMQRHLTVVPPKEWESRPLDESSPYYYGCTRYVLREGGVTVLACPMMDQMVFDQPGTLEALMEDAVRLGRSVVRYGSWGLDIWMHLTSLYGSLATLQGIVSAKSDEKQTDEISPIENIDAKVKE